MKTEAQLKLLASSARSLSESAQIASENPEDEASLDVVRRYRHGTNDAGVFLTKSREKTGKNGKQSTINTVEKHVKDMHILGDIVRTTEGVTLSYNTFFMAVMCSLLAVVIHMIHKSNK